MSEMFTDSVIEGNPVFEQLVEMETATAKEIANNVDVSKRTVERELSELHRYGEITKTETTGAFEADKWHSNVTGNSRLKTISIDNLFIDPSNSRTSSNARIDNDFRQSIKEHGVIEPPIVREKETESIETADNKGTPEAPAGEQEYWIVAGRRRFLAAVEALIPEIECVIKNLNDYEAASVSFHENER